MEAGVISELFFSLAAAHKQTRTKVLLVSDLTWADKNLLKGRQRLNRNRAQAVVISRDIAPCENFQTLSSQFLFENIFRCTALLIIGVKHHSTDCIELGKLYLLAISQHCAQKAVGLLHQ